MSVPIPSAGRQTRRSSAPKRQRPGPRQGQRSRQAQGQAVSSSHSTPLGTRAAIAAVPPYVAPSPAACKGRVRLSAYCDVRAIRRRGTQEKGGFRPHLKFRRSGSVFTARCSRLWPERRRGRAHPPRVRCGGMYPKGAPRVTRIVPFRPANRQNKRRDSLGEATICGVLCLDTLLAEVGAPNPRPQGHPHRESPGPALPHLAQIL